MDNNEQGVFDDFTVASSWERLISDIEATCKKWETGYANDFLASGAEGVDGHGKLHRLHGDLTYGSKTYQLDFCFEIDGQDRVVDEWQSERHHLQLWFGVQEFLVLTPVSMSGVILDAPEATSLLSAVSIALSNCGSAWPAFIPVHDPTRKSYKGIQGMRGPYCRSFEADRIGSQVPIKLMHLEGLYELFISKLAFSLPISASEYEGKIRSTVRLTYQTPMPGFEIVSTEDPVSPSPKAVENLDADLSSKVQWDEEYPWAEWYTVDDPIKGFELIATWSNRLVGSGLDMAEFENVSTFEADKWLLAPIMIQSLEEVHGTNNVSFASRMRNLLEAFSISKEAKFMEDFCTGDRFVTQKITSSSAIPPQTVLDRVLRSLLPEGHTLSSVDNTSKEHDIAQGIKGAPSNSLFGQFCLHALWFGNCNISAISILWIEFVREVRWCWEEVQPLPRMLEDENPSFGTCLVHQKLQLLAACIRRKAEDKELHSKTHIKESLIISSTSKESDHEDDHEHGKNIPKEVKGPDQPESSILLLKAREKMHRPRTQKPPIMTEDMLLEREHALVVLSDSPSGKLTREKLQTSMLSSDMAAFKAANPRAVFEDFIRWHSPRDWLEEEIFQDSLESLSSSISSANLDNVIWPPKGKLSDRMAHPDNLWFQIWRSVEPLPAEKQKPLFDHTREGEKVIHYLETLRPHQLLAQMICTGFSAVADILHRNDIFKPKVLQVQIEKLYTTIVSTLKPLGEMYLSEKDVAKNIEDWHADIAELCSLLERTEKLIILAASLHQKLPDALRLISNLLSNYISLESQKRPLQEGKFQHAVSGPERVSIARLFPPVSLSQTQRTYLRMGNFLNGHEPSSREIIFSHFDHYSEGQRERYQMDGSNQWHKILSHRMYIQGSANDLQVAYSVVSND